MFPWLVSAISRIRAPLDIIADALDRRTNLELFRETYFRPRF